MGFNRVYTLKDSIIPFSLQHLGQEMKKKFKVPSLMFQVSRAKCATCRTAFYFLQRLKGFYGSLN
jgi:hypothetical protein